MSEGEKCWSNDNETFFYDLEMVIDDAREAGSTTIYEGEKVDPMASQFVPDVEWLLDHMREQACEVAGEHAESFALSVTNTAALELEQFLKAWADKHVDVDFFTVINVRRVGFNDEGEIVDIADQEHGHAE